MAFTRPTSTSLYLTWVLPGSSPSASLKLIVICGPFSVTDLITSATPISAAISGITQTSDGNQWLRGSISGSGRLGGSVGPFESLRGALGAGVGPCGLVMFGPEFVGYRFLHLWHGGRASHSLHFPSCPRLPRCPR